MKQEERRKQQNGKRNRNQKEIEEIERTNRKEELGRRKKK